MAPIVHTEYRNQHSYRNYPFGDNTTLSDTSGVTLPTDFLVDAFLYPIDAANGVHLSKIDRSEQKIYFADSSTGTIHGVAEYADGDTSAAVYDPVYDRAIGMLVFGLGLSAIQQGENVRVFTSAATGLAPSAWVQLNQDGVRGIQLEDVDRTLVTGVVQFEGASGVTVNSEIDSGQHELRFDMRGSLPPRDDDCVETCPLITSIRVIRRECSQFMVTKLEPELLAIYGACYTLDDLCAGHRARTLPRDGELPPAGDDPCETPTPAPGDCACGAEVTLDYDVTDMDGRFTIVAPTISGDRNLFKVVPMSQYGMPGTVRMGKVGPMASHFSTDGDQAAEKFRDPPWPADGLVISMRGQSLKTGKRRQ